MPAFSNADLLKIASTLTCGCCENIFKGTVSQAQSVKYKKRKVYCSKECFSKQMSILKSRPVLLIGICPTCNKDVWSKDPNRKYCSSECYHASPDFAKRVSVTAKATVEKKKNSIEVVSRICHCCKRPFNQNAHRKEAKYCSNKCKENTRALKRREKNGTVTPSIDNDVHGTEMLMILVKEVVSRTIDMTNPSVIERIGVIGDWYARVSPTTTVDIDGFISRLLSDGSDRHNQLIRSAIDVLVM